jgi:signal transduction histidine kinase/DNA-binding NarL/FixJ family response regulator
MKALLVALLTLATPLAQSVLAKGPAALQPQLTNQEQAWLAAGHNVRARIADYPPYMLKEPRAAGLAVDYLDHIAEQFGFAVEYIAADMTFAAAVEDVAGEHRHYDLLLTFTRTPQREKRFAITADYLSAPWVIFTRLDSPYIMGLESLSDKTVAVEKGFLIARKLTQDFPAIRMLEVRTALDALMALATGQADAYVGNLAVGAFMVKEHRLTNLMVAAPTRYGINTQAMAVRPDWPELAAIINKGIASMTTEDRNAIIGKWINLEMKPRKDYTLAFIILVAASLIVLAVSYWNRRLVREVQIRQRAESELRTSEALLETEKEALQRTKTELQQNKDVLQELNATLEARLVAAVHDRTRALSEAAARAQESDRTKSAFLSAVSHDLRSPLHDILGYARLLGRQLPPPARDHLNIIQDSGNHLLRLIDDILTYSRGEANCIVLVPGPLSLSRLAEHLTLVYQPVAERANNHFVVHLDTGSIDWVLADEPRLTQVLRNLLDNAFKFTRDGRVQLRIELAEPLGPGTPAPGVDCLMRFCVSDTGIGIPASKARAIFQPFQRLERHRSLPGVGLGLAIAQQYADAMGSKIVLQSSQEKAAGSTFSFQVRLPISAVDDEGCDEDTFIKGYLGPRRTVLIADDQATSREVLAECCRTWGFTVLVASDGAEALEHFRMAEPAVDLVVVDQFMPGLDGWGFLHALRSSERGTHVPAMLISAAPAQRPDGFPDGMAFDQFAMKPLAEPELATRLGELLGLEWEYETESAGETAPEPGLTSLSALTADERARFNEMVAIGQILRLQGWARDMAEKHPEREAIWRGIEQICRRVDLPALKRLAAEVASD